MSSAQRVRTAIDNQEIVAILPGRYASTPHNAAFVVRAHAATASTAGILTGAAALFIHGAVDRAPGDHDVAIAPGHRCPTADWLHAARVGRPIDHRMHGVVPVAEPAESLLHAWAHPMRRDRTGLVLTALQRTVVTPAALLAAAEARPRLAQRRELEKVVAGFRAGAHSFLEYEGLRRVFTGREFARIVRQHQVFARGRRRWLDMYDPATRTAIELDGSAFHAAGERREEDARRDADLATLGILTVRLTYSDMMSRPEWCRDTVRSVIRARGEPLGSSPPRN